jgi:ABC-type transport system involved in multi-copper enzyme maturation permease subunit
MRAPEVIYACRWLIRDTFRQALANSVFWLMLASAAVVIFFCLGITIEGGESLRPTDDIGLDKPHGRLNLAFGAWRIPLPRDGLAMAHFILMALGEGAFGIVGTLFALVLTAGFIPEFLQPANATVLLAKPVPRWVLLLGKYLGVMALLAFYVALFVVGTWLVLGMRTGFWVNGYLWGLPLLLLQVAAIYGFSVFLGVWTRSTLACVVGSVLFWFTCSGMNYGRHYLVVNEPDEPFLRGLVEVGYWILPKPVDLGMLLHEAVESGQSLPLLQAVKQQGAFHPGLSVLASLAFAVGMVAIAAQLLRRKDY